jgi:hypothetical protein
MTRRRHRTVPAWAVACLVLAACGSAGSPAATTAASTSASAPSSTSASTSASTSSAPPSSPPASTSASSSTPDSSSASAAKRTPPAHVVVVVEENHSYGHVLSSPSAGYFRSLAAHGASMTNFYAITHPSEPNYLALFSGSTHHLSDDSCPHTYAGGNLGAQLRRAGRTFAGYSEGLPATGYTGCTAGRYARKHAPWTDFSTLPGSVNRPLSAFPTNFARLPTVAFVIPNLDHDMHDGTVGQADTWLRRHLDPYQRWARSHHSVLVVTWDEDDHSAGNRIPTIITGAGVRPGHYGERADLYRLLRTLQWQYGLPALGASAGRRPITDVWTR